MRGEHAALLLAAAGRPGAAGPSAALPWSDLLHCLARAFLPPPADLTVGGWCDALAGDLADLERELGLDLAAAIETLRREGSAPATDEPWLVQYSRLFLVPPVPVTLNTGIYLEGGLAGVSAQMMAQCYATAGFAQREAFRDLPDHVAMQLEFVAALFDRAARGDSEALGQARDFLAAFVDHWAQPLRQACERAAAQYPEANAFAALARVVETAVAAQA